MADIEDLIRRYRPLGPPADLRARVVSSRPLNHRAWLMIAASALLALTCELLSGHEQSMLREALIGERLAVRDQQVRALARKLGNDQAAMVQAELLIDLEEQETTAP